MPVGGDVAAWIGDSLATACAPWAGPKSGEGYGLIWAGSRYKSAHREAWQAKHGPIPAGMVIRHLCDNPACVNPDHLALGTHADNVADRVARGRSATGERNGRSKLTRNEAIDVRRRYEAGELIAAIARTYGIDRKAVHLIGRGVIWPDLGAPLNPAACHPERAAYSADGRCRPCYMRDWKASRVA